MMQDEGVSEDTLEQVQELQHQLQEVLEGQYPPRDPETHQNWTHHQSQSHPSLVGSSKGCCLAEGQLETS